MSMRRSGYRRRIRSIARGTMIWEIEGTEPMRNSENAPRPIFEMFR